MFELATDRGKMNTTRFSATEIAAYHERGYTGPFDLMEREHALALGDRILARRGKLLERLRRGDFDENRHETMPELMALCTRPEVLDRVEALLGPDLVLWRTRIHAKSGDLSFPFHQDGAYWPLRDTRVSPPVDAAELALSAWFALTDTDLDNGCVELVPGTHRVRRPHAATAWRYRVAATGDDLPDLRTEPMILKAGQFFLFHNLVLHRSGTNTTPTVRLGFVARFTVAGVALGDTDGEPPGIRVRARGPC